MLLLYAPPELAGQYTVTELILPVHLVFVVVEFPLTITPPSTRTIYLYNTYKEIIMETTYSEARANFAAIWDKVIEDREQVVIKRRGKEDIVMIARSELDEVMETAHLLRSPRNAERLLSAIKDSDRGRGIEVSLEELKQSILADEE